MTPFDVFRRYPLTVFWLACVVYLVLVFGVAGTAR